VRGLLSDAPGPRREEGSLSVFPAGRVTVHAGDVLLEGDMVLPEGRPLGIVLIAHGSGSSRHSPRNRQVAARLHDVGVGTILIDLLTHAEQLVDRTRGEHRFDIGLPARRVTAAVDWLSRGPAAETAIGLFGASTGAGAVLAAAAARPDEVSAVVSRGGRPDLAGEALPRVRAPTLLIVGGADPLVLELNRQALEPIGAAEKELVVVPNATHLFEEPGALDEVAALAADWFVRHLEQCDGSR
jgi:putative phosphoribosyl transferase